MKRSWRWLLAGLLAGGLAGTTVLIASAVGAFAQADPVPSTSERQLREILHRPPLILRRGEPVRLRYEAVCSVDELGTPCSLSGHVHVRPHATSTFTALPLTETGDGALEASPSARLTRDGFEYYAVVETANGQSLTLPAAGAASPQSATVVRSWVDVDLGRHTFGATRRAQRVVASAAWGDGPTELGLDSGPEQARIGPSAFDVAPDGSVVVLDQVNRRLASFRPGGGMRPDVTPIPFAGGEGDIAVDRDGSVVVLDDGGNATATPMVRRFGARGGLVSSTPLGAPGADMLRIGADGPVAHTYPAEKWFPLGSGRQSLAPAEQRRGARSERLSAAGAGVLVDASPTEARFALLRDDRVVGAWRVTSATQLGEVQLAEPYGNGLLVVVRLWTEEEAEFRVLELTPAGLGASFTVERAEWAESAPLSRFRLDGRSLYQLRSSPSGAQVVQFELGGTR